MIIWQADFYRRPLKDEQGEILWELLICDSTNTFIYQAFCPQSQVNASWLAAQLQIASASNFPKIIQVFRPQSLGLIETAAKQLGIKVEATRRTYALKQLLQKKAAEYAKNDAAYNPLAIDKPPPLPLPEKLWGEQWRFASLPAGELEEAMRDRPIPILDMPEFLLPINLGLASTMPIPGIVIYGGKQSLRLARWLEEIQPVAINYTVGEPSGLVLEASLVDRWIIATFEDKEVAASAQLYEQRKQLSKGLHFLLVQPDDSGMTYSGFWLLKLDR